MAIVDEPDGPAGDAGQLGRGERLEAGALLAAEAAADELRPHPDVVLPQPERGRELLAGGEHALRRHPGGELVPVPRGDRRMGLERSLQLGGGGDRDLYRDLGRGERGLRVAAGVVARLADEVLLVHGLSRVDDVREHLDVERQRAHALAGGLERVGRDDGDRLPGVAGLGREERSRTRQRQLALGPDHSPNARHGEGRLEVERADAPMRDGRAQHRRVKHPRQLHVDRVARAPGHPHRPVKPRCGLADDRELVAAVQLWTSSASSTSAQTSS